MMFKISFSLIVLFMFSLVIKSQSDTYVVKKASFSSDRYHEFSPVFYKNGIIFCTNRGGSSLVEYSGEGNNGAISVFFVESKGDNTWKKPKLFSKFPSSKFNDGPVTFNADGNKSYYSRNMFVALDPNKNPYYRNKLGLFSTSLIGDKWSNISPFRHNNDWFNITTPCLAPDGNRLYFSSDKPDGFGGADLYYCDWDNGYWDEPVNLGPEINTAGNEAYPFLSAMGELFFSSDGHPGLGGKDIFVTKPNGNGWHKPVRLDAPINSEYDDFGIVSDTLMNSGFFSSHRNRSIDVYSFNTLKHPVWFSTPQKENSYCVSLKDEGTMEVDTLLLQYEWDFGGGVKKYGLEVQHCFAKAGDYTVKSNIVGRREKELFLHKGTFIVTVSDLEQPLISSDDFAMVGNIILFDGAKSNYPSHDILEYYWQLDDSTFKKGSECTHQFNKEGEWLVKLALSLKSKDTGELSKHAVSKSIVVFSQKAQKDKFLKQQKLTNREKVGIPVANNFSVKQIYAVDDMTEKERIFRLQLLASPKQVPLNSPVFNKVPSKFNIQEYFDEKENSYCYIIDQQYQLISLYPAYDALKSSGYAGARVTYNVLLDPADKDLFRIVQKYGSQIDDFFNSSNTLKTNGILMLNNFVGLLHKYPNAILNIDVHSDNFDSTYRNKSMSQSYAQMLTDYLVSTGINSNRLIGQGNGAEYPIRTNLLEEGRNPNRRVEFRITHKNGH